ncbi:replication-relaxation family protein [Evansella tamaricis]|uniref:Replication-relaxation family protein n=1 Tax=Evansella tamaricis TaxID=2069301 RepID=A0ABS6JL51_9BACI|nr:replication-relaxation family protein [Evansella tamaricis]MBU9714402.1 replication-relaxation family protein [Evansella tamaricis]
MIHRDKQIIKAVEKFRCLERYHIERMFFNHCQRPQNNANISLKRLRDRGYLVKAPSRMPYVYIPKSNTSIKRNSNKIDHFLAIADTFIDLAQPKTFDIEPRFNADVRPDIWVVFRNSPFYFEVQRTVYSQKVMQKKIDLYEEFYKSGEWQSFKWQPKNKKVFPYVILLSDCKYDLKTKNVKVFQFKSVHDILITLQTAK